MLDEPSRRRPDFAEGVAVTLADGQPWQLRRPIVRFVPADNAVGYEVCLSLAEGDGFGAAMAAYEACGDGPEVIGAELRLARLVLAANYDLTTPEVASLLQFGYSEADPDGVRIRDEVMAVVLGRDPKSPAGGDGSAPMPPA